MPETPVPARPASTVLLLRDGAEGLEVFMVVRNDAVHFAANALVFPGGRVDAPDGPGYEGLRVGAIRETFEECGLLLARPHGTRTLLGPDALLGIADRHRAALARGEISMPAVAAAERLDLATDFLVPFAHWITPASMAKRYDTHFFLAAAPPDQLALHDGGETVDSVWITPAQAIAEAQAGRFKLVFPTFMNLQKLGRHPTVAAAIEAARATRVVTVEPVAIKHDGALRQLRIPLEAGYGGEVFEVDLPPSIGALPEVRR